MAARSRASKAAPTTLRQVGVLLEEVRSQQSAMLEAMTSWGERLERKIDSEIRRVDERLANLEAAVLQNSRDIRKNSEDIKRLETEVVEVRNEVRRLYDTRPEKGAVAALEERVAILERHLGIG